MWNFRKKKIENCESGKINVGKIFDNCIWKKNCQNSWSLRKKFPTKIRREFLGKEMETFSETKKSSNAARPNRLFPE